MAAAHTRRQIVETADRLFYENGYEATAFADIAGVIGISRGNFYYHFKTKDEILDAVIALRLDRTRAMLSGWEAQSATPPERILSFVGILIANRAKIMRYGCPVGTLCDELAKLEHGAHARAVDIFSLFRDWLAVQFAAMGRAPDAEALALHVLMRSQGVATLAAAFRDEAFIDREVEEMRTWLLAQSSASRPASAA